MLVNKICEHLSERFINDELSNDDMIQIIECIGGFLNLRTISDYAKENSISYNGAKHFRNVRELFKVKFVIDNN